MLKFLSSLVVVCLALSASFAADSKPLKILLITGGCCHNYNEQKDILKNGIEARLNATVDQIHVEVDSRETKPPLPIYGNPDYANGYDLVIHDECAAGIDDPKIIDGVLKPHRDGVPAVNLHCAMHSYRFGNWKVAVPAGADNAKWYEYLGMQSTTHGARKPIAITFVDKTHPICKGLEDWTTIEEELYNNVQVLTAHALAKGKQIIPAKTKGNDGAEAKEIETVVAWTNEYGDNKTKIFCTTIGHDSKTVADSRYLDLVAHGVLWVTGHLNDDGTATAGFAR